MEQHDGNNRPPVAKRQPEVSRALFLDRDGVLNVLLRDAYVRSPDELQLLPGAAEAVSRLRKHFDKILIVTNQQGIGKGLMTEADLEAVHQKLLAEIGRAGGSIDAIYHCPHLESEHHFMRKPNIGMALKAKHDFPDIKLKESVMVGDSLTDMLFGRRAGMTTVLVGNHSDAAVRQPQLVDLRFADLMAFAASPYPATLTRGSMMP